MGRLVVRGRTSLTICFLSNLIPFARPCCLRAKSLLNRKGVSFQEIHVDHDQSAWAAMTMRSRRNTVPQIFIDNVHVGGCDDLYAMEQAGKLDPMLARNA